MADWIELTGSSGKRYRYVAAARMLPSAAGNFALVRDAEGGRGALLEVGETDVLVTGAADAQAKARQKYGEGVQLFIRLNVSGVTRREETADLKASLEAAAS